jgi:hypothetical protein
LPQGLLSGSPELQIDRIFLSKGKDGLVFAQESVRKNCWPRREITSLYY